ncbi:excalibur calcium-binding domain-containing protein [Oerskovia sp. NPDC060338]|uniref:excalibur calcium-binding domain-containing protein n=1 Tax=Oerskovia sp. NPDC060338 TaxID=3347100 RepID=UPI00364D4533
MGPATVHRGRRLPGRGPGSARGLSPAGEAPIRVGEPGYSKKLDRDGDGVGCEEARSRPTDAVVRPGRTQIWN